MANITSLQIGQNKIQVGNYKYIPDIDNYESLHPTFTNKTYYSNNAQFYCCQYTATEDCYIEFVGNFSDTARIIHVVDITNENNIIIHERFHSNELIGWQYIDDQLFMPKGHTYEYRTQGYTNPSLIKFGVKKYFMD